MQAVRTRSSGVLRLNSAKASRTPVPRRFQSSNPPQPSGASTASGDNAKPASATTTTAAIVAVVAAVAGYSYYKTGSPDRVAKAVAKAGVGSQKDGGLGRMHSEDKKLHMGEDSPEATEPASKIPPSHKSPGDRVTAPGAAGKKA